MTTILLLFGGESPEHEVSIASATNVLAAIDREKYAVELGFISKEGEWRHVSAIEKRANGEALTPDFNERCFRASKATLRPQVILPVLHGENGEDGAIAALGKLLHIPVAGCDMTSAAVAMDKVLTKQVLTQAGIPVVPFTLHFSFDSQPDFATLAASLGNTLFVKPARLGSSVGVSKVHTSEALSKALKEAHAHDSKVLIEQAITGRELEVAVLGNPGAVSVSGVGEIKPQGDFYSYESKYDSASTSEVIIPAELPKAIAEDIRLYAQQAYEALGCRGLARVDFFYSDDGAIYLNEVNTFPGFTNISMYPKLWQHHGLSYAALGDKIISLALEK